MSKLKPTVIKIACTIFAMFAMAHECPADSLKEMAQNFSEPPIEYRPYVWWHWMGSNFSKEGISKDLEAMKDSGIAGATIINLSSGVQESHVPIKNNPWPGQTYRSAAYWDAMKYAAEEAKRLGLKIGLQNTPGYSTTGGPWITEETGMQKLVLSETKTDGGKKLSIALPQPELPVYTGWGSFQKRAEYYKDIAVLAVAENASGVKDVIDITDKMEREPGMLKWIAPNGKWHIYRIGHAPTMSNPHPLPDDLIGKAFESDKMSKEVAVFHWRNILEPLQEHLGALLGDSFTHILIDSYEAGDQDWTPAFRNEFISINGYDPLPWIALRQLAPERNDVQKFSDDYRKTVSRLYIENGWKTAKEMINKAGLAFIWEPYHGPFDTYESVSLADIPMGEFWTGSEGRISPTIVDAAKHYGKRIVAAEAFTGSPNISKYTEDPAFLKRSADGCFVSGANLLFLHHWVHQPFDDKYQPGMGMGWWGTHFGRHQTWLKPGKAFFTYLSRCQMMLQQGEFVSSKDNIHHRKTPECDIYFVANPRETKHLTKIAFEGAHQTAELWDPAKATIENANASSNDQFLTVELEPGESVFVVVPKEETGNYSQLKKKARRVIIEKSEALKGKWDVEFFPKLDNTFKLNVAGLFDFASSDDPSVKYFSGTAVYKKKIKINASEIGENKKVMLDLGELHDMAEISVNGRRAGTLWFPPYKTDITSQLKAGINELEISVTNNWANRLIGDEQHPADFEYGADRGAEVGRPLAAFPEWFVTGQKRPSTERKTFSTWHYYRRDSRLHPAGLIGPVKIVKQELD